MEHYRIETGDGYQGNVRLKILNCAFLVLLADWLFFHHAAGWTLAIFVFVLLVIYSFHHSAVISQKPATTIALLICGLILALVENPNTPAEILTCLGIVALVMARNNDWRDSAIKFMDCVRVFVIHSWQQLFKDIYLGYRLQAKNTARGKRKPGFARNWTVPASLALAFTCLFAVANPIISEWIEWLDLHFLFEFLMPERLIFWGGVLIASWALIRYRMRGRLFDLDLETGKSAAEFLDFLLAPGAIMRGLIIFNVLFLIQSGLDVVYLWGGKALPDGLTYADYAHRGAYPLMATALLAGIFVLIALRPGSSSEASDPIRKLVYLWIVQNIFLVASSLWRMHLYVEVYSLTMLRVSAVIWMFLVGMGLIWIILRIANQKSGIWLVNRNAITLLATIYLCSFVNFNGIIAQYNVEHSLEIAGKGQPLDLEYMAELGPDALPALKWFRWRNWSDLEKIQKAHEIEKTLTLSLKNSMDAWRNWTFRKHRLSQEFKGLDMFVIRPI